MKEILHSKPWLCPDDMERVRSVMSTNMIGQGELTREFERAISDWIGAEAGIAVGSGTAAILLAIKALEVDEQAEVVLPTYVCASVLEAVVTSGAKPVLCDVGPDWVITPPNVARVVSRRTKALVIPHIYGIFADVESFRIFGVPIIEDLAQGFGHKEDQGVQGDIAIFSFHPTKCLTTGEGGMAVSRDSSLVTKMRQIRDGNSAKPASRLFSPMSDVAAALGLSQLSRYSAALARRKKLALGYRTALEKVLPEQVKRESFEKSMHFRFPLTLPGGLEVYQPHFAEKHIHVRRGVDTLLHRLMTLPDAEFPTAVSLYNTTVSLPIYPALTDDEHAYCVKTAVAIFSTVRPAALD